MFYVVFLLPKNPIDSQVLPAKPDTAVFNPIQLDTVFTFLLQFEKGSLKPTVKQGYLLKSQSLLKNVALRDYCPQYESIGLMLSSADKVEEC